MGKEAQRLTISIYGCSITITLQENANMLFLDFGQLPLPLPVLCFTVT
jgi:hypothetical protein